MKMRIREAFNKLRSFESPYKQKKKLKTILTVYNEVHTRTLSQSFFYFVHLLVFHINLGRISVFVEHEIEA